MNEAAIRKQIGQSIACSLRDLRRRAGLTQTQIARLLGVTYQQVQKYESGRNKMPVESIVILRHFYGVTYDEVFRDADECAVRHMVAQLRGYLDRP